MLFIVHKKLNLMKALVRLNRQYFNLNVRNIFRAVPGIQKFITILLLTT